MNCRSLCVPITPLKYFGKWPKMIEGKTRQKFVVSTGIALVTYHFGRKKCTTSVVADLCYIWTCRLLGDARQR